MGGFSAQVENGQNGQPSGKGGPAAQATQSVDSSAAPKPLDGIQNAYFAQAPMPSGKGNGMQGQQGSVTYSATSGQPSMGSPNPYPNTIGMGDNQGNQPMSSGGKGKGA